MITKALQGCFITGTDTGVGKTFVGSALTQMLVTAGIDAQPRKPVETGCARENGELIPSDGSSYFDAVGGKVPLTVITPYRFATAASPERAARLSGATVTVKQAVAAVRSSVQADSFLIVEGAGGFYSPLCSDGSCAELAKDLKLPVVIVAEDRLGCLNHILLTLGAVEYSGLKTVAIVLNQIESDGLPGLNNAEDLLKLTSCPVFRIPANPSEKQLEKQLYPVVKLLTAK